MYLHLGLLDTATLPVAGVEYLTEVVGDENADENLDGALNNRVFLPVVVK